MKVVFTGVLVALWLLSSGCRQPSDAELLVGSWNSAKAEKVGMVAAYEFRQNGTYRQWSIFGETTLTTEGTYTTNGSDMETVQTTPSAYMGKTLLSPTNLKWNMTFEGPDNVTLTMKGRTKEWPTKFVRMK